MRANLAIEKTLSITPGLLAHERPVRQNVGIGLFKIKDFEIISNLCTLIAFTSR
jgi:hypothetical protein